MLHRIKYSSILVIILLVVFSVFFNNLVIQIRLQEADYHLHMVAQNEFAQKSFIISSKYALIKKRIESGESEVNNYLLEGKIESILSEELWSSSQTSYTPLPPYHPVAIILQSLRTILGKEQLILPENSAALNRELEIAFFLERNRNYKQAILSYNKLLAEQELNTQVYTSILLHKAFCISMLGKLPESVKLYDEIHSKYPETEAGIISKDLSDFVHTLIERNRKIARTKQDDLFIGRQLYFNMNYSDALPYLSQEIAKGLPGTESEARYFKGRVHEEVGQFRQATFEYHKIMYLGRNNRWSRSANRRLVMLNSVYRQEHPLVESAQKNLSAMGDSLFLNSVEEVAELILMPKKEETLKVKHLEEPLSIDDTLLTTLDIRFDFEEDTIPKKDTALPKKKHTPVVRKRAVKSTTQPVKTNKVLTKEEKIERTRKLANSEFRRASFIRETINSYSPNIQKIYLDVVNSGEDIAGKITVKMHILASGKITASIVESDINNTQFEKRVIEEVSRWKFPAIDDELGTLTISYPFNFKQ